MTIVIYDTFTEGSDTALTSHTPDTGTSWTEAYNTMTSGYIQVDGSNDYAEPTDSENNVGVLVVANPSATNADVDVEITLKGLHTASAGPSIFIVGRYQDTSNYYALQLKTTLDSDYAELLKVSGGSYASLDTAEPGLAVNDIWKLEIRGTSIKAYRDSGGGYSEVLSATDSDISSAGQGGLGWGDLGPVGEGVRAAFRLDDFTLTEAPVNVSVTAVDSDALVKGVKVVP